MQPRDFLTDQFLAVVLHTEVIIHCHSSSKFAPASRVKTDGSSDGLPEPEGLAPRVLNVGVKQHPKVVEVVLENLLDEDGLLLKRHSIYLIRHEVKRHVGRFALAP